MEKMSRKQENNKEKNIFGMDGMPPPPTWYTKYTEKSSEKMKTKQGLLRSGSRTYKILAAIVRMLKLVKHDDAFISSFIEFC